MKNSSGKKIIDVAENNLHLVGYSKQFKGTMTAEELLPHLHTLPNKPNWIPYRTTYYDDNWGFCCSYNLTKSDDFVGPFEVCVDTEHDDQGNLLYGEAVKVGEYSDEILISTYLCHPSMANDNLSGLITSILLFNEISKKNTRFTYRLVIVPETIGALAFLKANNGSKNVVGVQWYQPRRAPVKYVLKKHMIKIIGLISPCI